MAEIRIEGIWKIYNKAKTPALKDVTLTVQDREFMVLLGPSGCGKTTLLRCIAGLEYPDRGRIFIGGKDVTDEQPRSRHIAMVFQSYAVFPHLNVFENIAFGLRMQKRPNDEVKQRVERAAALMQIESYLDRFPAQLSGGQRQRVAVARGLVMEPEVLLMDEPLSNLDALLRLKARAELKRLLQEVKTTTVYVTHDQVEAMSMGDRIAVMQQGEIVQCDTPMMIYDRPANIFVGSFIGSPPMNFLQGVVANGAVQVGAARMPLSANGQALKSDQAVLLGIRPENVAILDQPREHALSARVVVVEPLGSHTLVTTHVGDEVVKVVTPMDQPIQPNSEVWLHFEREKIRWMDAASGQAL